MNKKLAGRINNLTNLGAMLRADGGLNDVIARASAFNPWFTEGFCHQAIGAITDHMLNAGKLKQWLSRYDMDDDGDSAKTVGIIMAGNLPLVGFHDFLCAYISGCRVKVKLSSKDTILFPYIFDKLCAIDESLREGSSIIERLEGFDAVIATGSNNSHRYFEYYFRQYPKILRKNRSSVAILTGNESDDELAGLADDIFMYFGFGCRNVSKLYVPTGYDITRLFPHFEKYKWMHAHTKYMNNYDYNRTLLLMNRTPHLANEIIMLQENEAVSSPPSVVYYEFYQRTENVNEKLQMKMENIQCVVCSKSIGFSFASSSIVNFGHTQIPELWDYSDNVDTMWFLIKLKSL